MIGGQRRMTADGGGGGDGSIRRSGRGCGTPSSHSVTQSRVASSARKRARLSRRSAVAKARRTVAQASSGSAREGGGDGDALPMVSPSPGRPVVVPSAALAVRVSDETCAAVELLLGHRFKSQAVLREAMSHASLSSETRSAAGLGKRSNERLEWLGDGALNLACAHFLHTRLLDYPEGQLSRLHSAIISRAACAWYAATLGLDGYLHVGLGWVPGPSAVAGNFFEALLGAIFVDGGWGAVEAFFTSRLEPLIVERLRSPPQDYRTILTNYATAQGQRLEFMLAPNTASAENAADRDGGNRDNRSGSSRSSGAPLYRLVDGATFDSVAAADGVGFCRLAMLDGEKVGSGWGRTRKAADMAASKDAFHRLRDRGCPIQEESGVDLRRSGAPNGKG
ncbi:hypothetical protein MMPV_004216 [Pyropia vietnamensis]